MSLFVTMKTDGIEPEVYSADPADLIAGNPEFTSWEVDVSPGGVSAGLWQATPGKWHFVNPYWEYLRIISGVSILTEVGGEPQVLKAGDSVVLRDGYKGTWEVVETTLKDYVVRE